MSYRHYQQSMAIVKGDRITDKVDFYAIIMAAMRRADTDNGKALAEAFPKQWEELQVRYNSPAGCVSVEEARACTEVEENALQTVATLFPMTGFPYG